MPSREVLGALALRVARVDNSTTGARATSGGAPEGEGALQGRTAPEKVVSNADWEEKAAPFVLWEGIPPVPAKLVARIWKGEYIHVDMADLLRDNLEADRRRSGLLTPSAVLAQAKPIRREVPDILSWAQCFSVYIGVTAEKQPHTVKQLLAYQSTVLREARRCGGTGWRGYDSLFRQLAAADNSSLYATTFLAQQSGGGGKMCQLCMGGDHTQEDCALAPLITKKLKSPVEGR